MKPVKTFLNRFFYSLFNKRVEGLFDEKDPRSFGAKVLAGEITRVDITDESFQTCHFPELIHQKSTDFCAGCSKAYGKEATEGMKMSWAGAFAMAMKAQGFISDWGTSILQVMRGAQKFGIPELSVWPYTGNRNESADYKRMSASVLENAAKHKDESFFVLDIPAGFDQFDTFRAYLNKFKDKKVVIHSGVDAHAVTIIGQTFVDGELKLFGPDSYGTHTCAYRIGKCVNGYRIFSRWETNQLFTGYMSFDMPRTLAELLVKYDGKAVKKQGGADCYLVHKGKKCFIKNEAVAWAFNTLLFGDNFVHVITQDEFDLLPMGEQLKFEDGANSPIILRILEKLNRTELINAD
jgi:hypothetical protein